MATRSQSIASSSTQMCDCRTSFLSHGRWRSENAETEPPELLHVTAVSARAGDVRPLHFW